MRTPAPGLAQLYECREQLVSLYDNEPVDPSEIIMGNRRNICVGMCDIGSDAYSAFLPVKIVIQDI